MQADEPVVDGRKSEVLVELDMVMSVDDYERIYDIKEDNDNTISSKRIKRKAVRETYGGLLWPDSIIPYTLASNTFSYSQERYIEEAIDEWEKYTCIKFRKVNNNEQRKIVFQNGNGCWSYIGMKRGYATQFINLAPNCRYTSVILHEIGHAIGFFHEHTRPDRDEFVYILEQNLQSSMMYNFKKYTWSSINSHGVPYDYTSIMHYGKRAFSKNGGVTVATKDSSYQNRIGSYQHLSFRDIKTANSMYECKPSWCRYTDNDCPGEGFIGKDCRCWCPGSPFKLCNFINTQPTTTTRRTTTTTRRPTTTTRRPTTATTIGECRDKNQRCPTWAKNNYCKSYYNYMSVYCIKSCDFCSGVITPPLPPVEKCENNDEHCTYWTRQGYCQHEKYKWYLTKNCMKSCGICTMIG
ncbi:zinc metalloproteinase nas-14 [Patella vulgata]|uniref:zinc metalloproteinase nas-14 n=1 Tax=Patella vulgata TaxID=6465 RepID=UPI00217F3AED|nr:zinc metalloproteinase nas-14 [Patella vulgata]